MYRSLSISPIDSVMKYKGWQASGGREVPARIWSRSNCACSRVNGRENVDRPDRSAAVAVGRGGVPRGCELLEVLPTCLTQRVGRVRAKKHSTASDFAVDVAVPIRGEDLVAVQPFEEGGIEDRWDRRLPFPCPVKRPQRTNYHSYACCARTATQAPTR